MTIRKKLCSRKGTTLVELMAAVVILVLLSMMMGTGFSLLMNAYHAMTAESEAQLLLSTAGSAIIDELSYADNIVTDASGTNTVGRVTRYDSGTFGDAVSMKINGDGRLILTGASGTKQLLASGAYGSDGMFKLQIQRTSGGAEGITYDSASGVFTFTLKVLENGQIRAEREFQVRCLNGGQ